MTRFGQLIDSEVPTLIDFYADEDRTVQMNRVLRDVAVAMGERAQVVKINIDKNPSLAKALLIKKDPTFVIYKNGEVKWRQSGQQDARTLIDLLDQFI